MQYSVPWTSLSIVFGIATRGTPASARTWEYDSVASPPIVTRTSMPRLSTWPGTSGVEAEGLGVADQEGCRVVEVVLDSEARAVRRGQPRRQLLRGHLLRIRPGGGKDRAARPLDRPRVDPVQPPDIAGATAIG